VHGMAAAYASCFFCRGEAAAVGASELCGCGVLAKPRTRFHIEAAGGVSLLP
jgi:hypothetical protein